MNSRFALMLAASLMIEANAIAIAQNVKCFVPKQVGEPVRLVLQEWPVDTKTLRANGMLSVFVGSDSPCWEGRTPIAGDYQHDGNSLAFRPTYDFVPGLDYVARIRWAGAEEIVSFRIPNKIGFAAASVTKIYPSGDILPENVLRFYLHFSVPMAPHVAFQYIKLRSSSGAADESAFMKFKQELWNEDRTRLTVLLDPGRTKRHVATNLELGPALVQGERYTLVVEEGWSSADGKSLLPAFQKSFMVGAPLRAKPDVRQWRSKSPRVGTRESLEITFDRPFDRHQLLRAIHVASLEEKKVNGEFKVGKGERSLEFVPDEEWNIKQVDITVDPRLEDVAGNNFLELLDQPVNIDQVRTKVRISVPVHTAWMPAQKALQPEYVGHCTRAPQPKTH